MAPMSDPSASRNVVPPRLRIVGPEAMPAARRPVRLLLVEPSAEVAAAFAAECARVGSYAADLVTVTSAAGAKAAAAAVRPDAVFCEFWLGDETCLPLVADMRAAAVPVVMMAGRDGDDYELICRRAGAAGFVARDDLAAAQIERLLSSLLLAPPGTGSDIRAGLRRLIESFGSFEPSATLPDAAAALSAVAASLTQGGGADILGRFAGLISAGRPNAVVAFDAVARIAEAAARRPAGGGIAFRRPMLPVIVHADPAIFDDLLQGLLAEAGADRPVRLDLALAGGRLLLTLSAEPASRPALMAASEAAAATARRLVVTTLARALGGDGRFDVAPRLAEVSVALHA